MLSRLFSIFLNALNFLLILGCVIRGVRKVDPPGRLFRYFTTLSNVYCGLVSLLVCIVAVFGELPLWARIVKYSATAAVTVTMVTVFVFLAPTTHAWKELLSGIQLFWHLICPLIALVSFLGFERAPMPVWAIAAAVLPILLYGVLYWHKILRAPEEKRWKDFYGFNRAGKPLVSIALITLGFSAILLPLWALCLI